MSAGRFLPAPLGLGALHSMGPLAGDPWSESYFFETFPERVGFARDGFVMLVASDLLGPEMWGGGGPGFSASELLQPATTSATRRAIASETIVFID